MAVKLDSAFDFSKDELGRVVNDFVNEIGKAHAAIRWIEPQAYEHCYVYDALTGAQKAFSDLLYHLICCAAKSVTNDCISTWASRKNKTVESEVENESVA